MVEVGTKSWRGSQLRKLDVSSCSDLVGSAALIDLSSSVALLLPELNRSAGIGSNGNSLRSSAGAVIVAAVSWLYANWFGHWPSLAII